MTLTRPIDHITLSEAPAPAAPSPSSVEIDSGNIASSSPNFTHHVSYTNGLQNRARKFGGSFLASHVNDSRLQAYLDGKLNIEDMVSLRRQLAGSPELQDRLKTLHQQQKKS
mgnify:FL=1|jgi:GrpB-like predicted nucleotidyltransferase (UPF0157 family)